MHGKLAASTEVRRETCSRTGKLLCVVCPHMPSQQNISSMQDLKQMTMPSLQFLRVLLGMLPSTMPERQVTAGAGLAYLVKSQTNSAVPQAAFEDVEFCVRAVKGGIHICYESDAVVRHRYDCTAVGLFR